MADDEEESLITRKNDLNRNIPYKAPLLAESSFKANDGNGAVSWNGKDANKTKKEAAYEEASVATAATTTTSSTEKKKWESFMDRLFCSAEVPNAGLLGSASYSSFDTGSDGPGGLGGYGMLGHGEDDGSPIGQFSHSQHYQYHQHPHINKKQQKQQRKQEQQQQQFQQRQQQQQLQQEHFLTRRGRPSTFTRERVHDKVHESLPPGFHEATSLKKSKRSTSSRQVSGIIAPPSMRRFREAIRFQNDNDTDEDDENTTEHGDSVVFRGHGAFGDTMSSMRNGGQSQRQQQQQQLRPKQHHNNVHHRHSVRHPPTQEPVTLEQALSKIEKTLAEPLTREGSTASRDTVGIGETLQALKQKIREDPRRQAKADRLISLIEHWYIQEHGEPLEAHDHPHYNGEHLSRRQRSSASEGRYERPPPMLVVTTEEERGDVMSRLRPILNPEPTPSHRDYYDEEFDTSRMNADFEWEDFEEDLNSVDFLTMGTEPNYESVGAGCVMPVIGSSGRRSTSRDNLDLFNRDQSSTTGSVSFLRENIFSGANRGQTKLLSFSYSGGESTDDDGTGRGYETREECYESSSTTDEDEESTIVSKEDLFSWLGIG